MTWRSPKVSGSLYLQRMDGSYQFPLTLKAESLKIDTNLSSWEEHIVRANCSFTIENDLSDFYELLPLMTISDGQYKVVVEAEGVDHFVGFLNCETINQNMLHFSNIRFTASGLLEKLKNVSPSSINILRNIPLIELIDDCLRLTGVEYPIRVNCSLKEDSWGWTHGAENTLFNETAVWTEIFWKNNVERDSALEILEKILAPFNCYLYWFREYWYIEHYEDLGDASKAMVSYQSIASSTGEYGWNAGGNDFNLAVAQYDIHAPTSRPQMGGSQVLSVVPGLQTLEIKLVHDQFFNLLNGDLSDFIESSDTFHLSTPELRTWYALDHADLFWLAEGKFGTIGNSINRQGYEIIEEDGVLNGLTTRFKITVLDDTEITIKFKWWVSQLYSGLPALFSSPENTEIVFNYYVRIGLNDYLVNEETADTWSIVSGVMTGNVHRIMATELDQDRWTYDGEIVIPIGEILGPSSGLEDDVDIIFRMGHEQCWHSEGLFTAQPADFCAYGDFHVAIRETPPDNLFRGEVSTDFLDKKVISLDLHDGGWSYRNTLRTGGVLVGGDYFNLTTSSWGYTLLDRDYLHNKLMESKFRLYRIARQRIKLDYFPNSPGWYRPLSLWKDNKQSDKEFIMLRNTHDVAKGKNTLELWEFDDTETINLI